MADQHGRYLESWELARAQAAALGEALYSASGLEPPVPLEQWDWTSASILSRLRQACDNILRRMLQPQQGGDAEVREAIGAVRNILISASDFKPGMSSMERLTKILRDFTGQDVADNGSITIVNLSPDEPLVINHQFLSGQDQWEPVERAENIEVKFKLENNPPGSILIRMTIDGNQRATAEASESFNRMSAELFDVGLAAGIGELKTALLDLIKGEGKRVTVLGWATSPTVDGLYIGRILSRKNDHLEAFIVSYNMSDGTTEPADVPENARESFRRAIHEVLLSNMST